MLSAVVDWEHHGPPFITNHKSDLDWSRAQVVTFPNLKPSTETISLRLPAPLLADLKALANKRDVPYQSLLKVFLAERVAAEWRRPRIGTAPSDKHLQPMKTRRVAKKKASRFH